MAKPVLTIEEMQILWMEWGAKTSVEDMRLVQIIGSYRDFTRLRALKFSLGQDVAALDVRIAQIEALIPPQARQALRGAT